MLLSNVGFLNVLFNITWNNAATNGFTNGWGFFLFLFFIKP